MSLFTLLVGSYLVPDQFVIFSLAGFKLLQMITFDLIGTNLDLEKRNEQLNVENEKLRDSNPKLAADAATCERNLKDSEKRNERLYVEYEKLMESNRELWGPKEVLIIAIFSGVACLYLCKLNFK